MSSTRPSLEQALGYRFRDPALLARALRHSSSGAENNERLEFLGDAVLEAVVSADLFLHHPDADEGLLSHWRAALVNRTALATLARRLELGAQLQLGTGEIKSGGRERDSILADAFEAVIGAVFVDGGYARARAAIRRVAGAGLRAPDAPAALVDSKSRLQEELQGRALPLPTYTVAQITGPEHAQVFHVVCAVEVSGIRTEGVGATRRAAEQLAAARALGLLARG